MAQQNILRISTVGVRGIVGDGLRASHILDFAAAFGTFVDKPSKIVLGRDPRASGEMIRQGVISALLACGHDVVDLSVVSTPIIQHSIRRLDAAGGVSIGASHNSADWNALKFFGPRGIYLSSGEAGELLDIYHLKKFHFVEWQSLGALSADSTALDAYLDDLARVFDFEALRGFRVLVDSTNGTSATILNRMNARFGFQFIVINDRLEGRAFAHEPATNKSMVALQLAPLMKHVGASAGFLFDVDSDRVALATEFGEAVSEEMVLPMLSDDFLERGPGKLVITNLSTTALLEEIAEKRGGTIIRVAVGRQAAIDALATYRPEEIAVAGEGTGAVMMPQFRFVYDGIASMLAILAMMRRRGQTLSQILRSYPKYSILKGELPLATRRIPQLFLDLEERYADGRRNTLDGLRVDWPGRWFHVRVSQTEPIVRVICEQKGEPPAALFDELLDRVRSFSA
jgi:phosphomannomutase